MPSGVAPRSARPVGGWLGGLERLDDVLFAVLHAVVGDGMPPLFRHKVGAAVDVIVGFDSVFAEFQAAVNADQTFCSTIGIQCSAPKKEFLFFFPENPNIHVSVRPLLADDAETIGSIVFSVSRNPVLYGNLRVIEVWMVGYDESRSRLFAESFGKIICSKTRRADECGQRKCRNEVRGAYLHDGCPPA